MHGRWPWGAAIGVVPMSALAARDRRWVATAALLAHQTEEWVYPDGFLPWFNREVLGSARDEWPLTRRLGLVVNVPFGWGVSVAAALAEHRGGTVPAAMLYVSHIGNAVLHVGHAVRHRRWNPGSVTAATLLAPIGVVGLARLARDPDADRRQLAAGVAAGVAVSAGLFAGLKARLRHGPDPA